MNPGWEIRYIEYSSEQLKNYEDQNDEILAKAGEKQKYSHVNFLSDEYRRLYLNKHTDELIVYCDLDCFPIAPFDNFFLLEKEGKFSEWISRGFCKNIHKIRTLGTCTAKIENMYMFKSDIWCMCNNESVSFNQFL